MTRVQGLLHGGAEGKTRANTQRRIKYTYMDTQLECCKITRQAGAGNKAAFTHNVERQQEAELLVVPCFTLLLEPTRGRHVGVTTNTCTGTGTSK